VAGLSAESPLHKDDGRIEAPEMGEILVTGLGHEPALLRLRGARHIAELEADLVVALAAPRVTASAPTWWAISIWCLAINGRAI
jgi:hypothetical protein